MGTNRALLVALKYKDDQNQKQIAHAVKQMYGVRDILTTRYAFDISDMIIMTDEEENIGTSQWPNADNVIKTLRQIIGQSRPGDKIVFYFNGHGNRQPDEPDSRSDTGYYEYLTMADTSFIPDYRVKEIESSIRDGVSFTLIAESCHSSGLMEGSHEVVGDSLIQKSTKKKTKKGEGSKKKKENKKKKDKKKTKGPKVETKPPRGILIAACQSYQKSHYGPKDPNDDDSEVVSHFTHVFLELLYLTEGRLSLQDLIVGVNRRLSRIIWRKKLLVQRAGLYCNQDQANQPFLGGMVVD